MTTMKPAISVQEAMHQAKLTASDYLTAAFDLIENSDHDRSMYKIDDQGAIIGALVIAMALDFHTAVVSGVVKQN